MHSLGQDLRQSLRVLVTAPGYSATALLTLALGIGFSTATFSVINAVLLRPLPYANPEQLLVLRERLLPRYPEFSVSPGHYLTWRREATLFDGIGAWGTQFVNLDTGTGEPERIRADRVSANLFPLLGVEPFSGRAFAEADDDEGAARVVLLSHGAWQRRFGGGDVVGRSIRMDRHPATIVGVMPAGFDFPSPEVEMWVPLAMPARERANHGSHYLSALARVKPGVDLPSARADLGRVASQLAQARAESSGAGWEVLAFPMHDYTVRNVKRALLVLLGAVAMVLLIACVNVANLLLARGASRQKEMAVRAAIGASRGRLVRQLVVEQLTLAGASAAAGLLVAGWLLRALLLLIPDALPRQSHIALDAQVLAFALLLAAATPLLFGLLPAVQASRPDLRELLTLGGRQGGPSAGRGVRRALVIAEVALAMVLLVGATLLIQSFTHLSRLSPGFAPARAIVASVNLPADRYPEGAARESFFGELLARAAALPQVQAIGLSQSVPMVNDFVSPFELEGETHAVGSQPTTNFYAVSPGYFEAMGIPLVRGRIFDDGDRRGSPPVILVNQLLAARHFGTENPIGRRMRVGQGYYAWREIVGVVGDVRQYGLGDRMSAQVYEPYLQHPYFSGFSLVVRTAADDPAAVVPDLRSIVRSLDSDLPLSRVRRLEEIVDRSIRPQRFSAVLLLLFSCAALLLAAIGVYGVVAYTVGLRRQEFAIRIAHGAAPGDILGLVFRGAAAMAAAGVAAGMAGAWLLRRTLDNLLHGVDASHPATYLAVGLVLTLIAMAASAVPALRATRVDPMTALRE